ncbi:7416_t:CDS:2 [Diversispora eburnea]|uniref:7416_t:CDS:1 n=1 Tax=Diversispora eburnea TaxID=1213867 RepID=A0A9N9GDY2_9GLOM|nr:7416_t:CDS:2 [Diversispora eburnea]
MDYRKDSSRISEDEDALVARINNNLIKLEQIEDEGVELLKSINHYHDTIHQTCKVVPEVRDQLKVLYKKAIDQSVREEE